MRRRPAYDVIAGAMIFAFVLTAMVYTRGCSDYEAALTAAAKPFEGHPDLVKGPGPEAVSRATNRPHSEGFEAPGEGR